MPHSAYTLTAEDRARERHAVKHSIEDGLEYVRPFNQRLVFQSGEDAASIEGVCIGCSALFLKNNKPWSEFKTFLTSEAGRARARRISNEIFRREEQISKEATAKRQALVDKHRKEGLTLQEGSIGQFVKGAFGFGNDAARAKARAEEKALNLQTVKDAHQYRMASYQECLCTPPLSLGLGGEWSGPADAYLRIPNGLFMARGYPAPLKKATAGCLIGMWGTTQIGERSGRLSQGHAFAVKPTQDVDGYAVFDPNYGEARFKSASDCSDFLGDFIGRIVQFYGGAWMIQQYLGCSPAAEEIVRLEQAASAG